MMLILEQGRGERKPILYRSLHRVIVYDRVIAVCRIRGRSTDDLLRARQAREAETSALGPILTELKSLSL